MTLPSTGPHPPISTSVKDSDRTTEKTTDLSPKFRHRRTFGACPAQASSRHVHRPRRGLDIKQAYRMLHIVVDVVVTANPEVPASTQYQCGDEQGCNFPRRWDWPRLPARKMCIPTAATVLGSPEGRERLRPYPPISRCREAVTVLCIMHDCEPPVHPVRK